MEMLPSKKHPGLHFDPPQQAQRLLMDHLIDSNRCSLAQACSIADTMRKDVKGGIIEDRYEGDIEYVLIA